MENSMPGGQAEAKAVSGGFWRTLSSHGEAHGRCPAAKGSPGNSRHLSPRRPFSGHDGRTPRRNRWFHDDHGALTKTGHAEPPKASLRLAWSPPSFPQSLALDLLPSPGSEGSKRPGSRSVGRSQPKRQWSRILETAHGSFAPP